MARNDNDTRATDQSSFAPNPRGERAGIDVQEASAERYECAGINPAMPH